MKKLFAMLCCCVLFLAGCGEKKTAEVELGNISFDAAVTYDTYSFACTVNLGSAGTFESEITAPESVAGTKLAFDGESLTVNYMGLEYKPELPLSQETANSIINQIFSSVQTGGQNAQKEDGNFILRGEVSGKKFSLYVTESGLPLSLSCPEVSLVAEFSNVILK